MTTESREQSEFTLKKIPQELLDRGRDLAGRGHEVWLAGLGAFAAMEEEGTAFFTDLVKRGRKVEDSGRKRLDAVRDRIEERQQRAVEELDDRVYQPMVDALRRFGVPTRSEIEGLSQKVDALTRQVQMLVARLPGSALTGVTTYYVMAGEEGWIVGQEGLPDAMQSFSTKDQALDHARELAHATAPSRLHVYRKDGSIQDTWSYEE
jgi:poly(hydroxyalkanoate) granule-associated protein